MTRTFVCYLHKPGFMAPDLRVISCDGEDLLTKALMAELPMWGPFHMIEVYDDADHPLFRLTNDGRMTQKVAG
jgi:hypothetical protein